MLNIAKIYTRAQYGVEAPLVTVETHISRGLPAFNIVGLPETVVRESKERVRSALLNCQFDFPAKRITVNLAPADLPKIGGRFDLPIALSILIASQQIKVATIEQYEFIGELSLTGELRKVETVLPAAMASQQVKRSLFLPVENIHEAILVSAAQLLPATHLLEVCQHLNGTKKIAAASQIEQQPEFFATGDLADIKGQQQAKRALEIAATGGHSLLLYGAPGVGKSMLAQRLNALLPPMTEQEALETTIIKSLAGHTIDYKQLRQRPFRAPHHTASAIALVGGGTIPKPGEISLAHNGVLFLDELPEFSRQVLETLRQPLETGSVTISRARSQMEFPADFQLITAMNPCPCGYYGDNNGRCNCTHEQIQRYLKRISGPILDRIDMHVGMQRINSQMLAFHKPIPPYSRKIQQKVITLRKQQLSQRGVSNNKLAGDQLITHCYLGIVEQRLLQRIVDKMSLSARAYEKLLRLARTIADLNDSREVNKTHISEAITYRKGTLEFSA